MPLQQAGWTASSSLHRAHADGHEGELDAVAEIDVVVHADRGQGFVAVVVNAAVDDAGHVVANAVVVP